jgi:hypothetical protein
MFAERRLSDLFTRLETSGQWLVISAQKTLNRFLTTDHWPLASVSLVRDHALDFANIPVANQC